MAVYNYYIRPDEMFVASGVTGAVEAGYTALDLMNGLPGDPVLAPTGTITWEATGTAAEVGLVAVCNPRIDSGKVITFGGSVSANTTMPAQYGGRPRNPWALISPAVNNPTTISVSITGNSTPVVIGDLVAGKARNTERPFERAGKRGFPSRNPQRTGLYTSVASYDYGVKPRVVEFTTKCTQAGLEEIEAWFDSCRDHSLHTLLVPTPSINDCMLALFTKFEYEKEGPQWFEVSLIFEDVLLVW